MRVQIKFDSATTAQVRQLSVALNQVKGDNRLLLGVEGPDGWHGETSPLSEDHFTAVVARLCKADGKTFAEIVEASR